ASPVSSTQINLSWTASTDASGIGVYRIERCSGPSCGNFAEITTVPGNQTTFQNSGLTASTYYTYRVRADDTVTPTPNQSGYSNLSSTTTLAPPDTTPPTNPTNLLASPVSSTQINLSWTASTDASGIGVYRIERCSGPSCGNFAEITTVPGNQTTFQNSGLTASTSYTYRVRADDTVTPTPNQSGYSNLSSTTTLAPPDTTPPTNPTNLLASPVSSTQINLSWTASTDASGIGVYRIERCSGPSCGNFAEITTVPGNQTTFQNSGLTASTSYTYRVRADDTVTPTPNQSGYSNLSSTTTLAPPDTTPPTNPTNLLASPVSSTQINLSWTASTDASGIGVYRIERCSGPSCGNFAEITTVPGNQTTFQNSGLTASTSYTYRVRADDTVTPTTNQSGYSNLSSTTTLAPPDTTPPTNPTNLLASPVSSTQINLSWTASTDASGIGVYRIERCSGPSCGNF